MHNVVKFIGVLLAFGLPVLLLVAFAQVPGSQEAGWCFCGALLCGVAGGILIEMGDRLESKVLLRRLHG